MNSFEIGIKIDVTSSREVVKQISLINKYLVDSIINWESRVESVSVFLI